MIFFMITLITIINADYPSWMDGSFLFHGICHSCPASCFKCSDPSGDLPFLREDDCEMKCLQPFKWDSLSGACQQDEAASPSFDSECQNERCETCDSEDRCAECAEGFMKVGWKCVKREHKSETIRIAKEDIDAELSKILDQSGNNNITFISAISLMEDNIFIEIIDEKPKKRTITMLQQISPSASEEIDED